MGWSESHGLRRELKSVGPPGLGKAGDGTRKADGREMKAESPPCAHDRTKQMLRFAQDDVRRAPVQRPHTSDKTRRTGDPFIPLESVSFAEYTRLPGRVFPGQPGESEHVYRKGSPLKDKSGIRTVLILGMILILQSSIASASGKRKQAQAKAMFQAAYAASEIKTKGSPPFHLKAEFQFYDSKFQRAKGSYDELWISPDQYKTSFSVPSGSDVIGVSNGQRWQKDTLPYTIMLETLVESAMDPGAGLHSGPPHKIKGILDETSGSRHMTCVVPHRKNQADEYCFDPQNGRLVHRTELEWAVAYQYSDYEPWGDKWFPRKIVIEQNGTPLVQIDVKSLTPAGRLSSSTFAPPPGAEVEKQVSCPSLRSVKLVKRVPPVYPESARRKEIEGVVRMYADIGKGGQIRGLKVIHTASPALDAAALQAVRQWHYQPATCKGVPFEVITTIDVRFQLNSF